MDHQSPPPARRRRPPTSRITLCPPPPGSLRLGPAELARSRRRCTCQQRFISRARVHPGLARSIPGAKLFPPSGRYRRGGPGHRRPGRDRAQLLAVARHRTRSLTRPDNPPVAGPRERRTESASRGEKGRNNWPVPEATALVHTPREYRRRSPAAGRRHSGPARLHQSRQPGLAIVSWRTEPRGSERNQRPPPGLSTCGERGWSGTTSGGSVTRSG